MCLHVFQDVKIGRERGERLFQVMDMIDRIIEREIKEEACGIICGYMWNIDILDAS